MDGILGGGDDQVDDSAHPVPHLGVGGSRVRKVGAVGYVVRNGGLPRGAEFAAGE